MMNKNTIIILLVIACLLLTIWGSFKDKQYKVEKSKNIKQVEYCDSCGQELNVPSTSEGWIR